MVICNYGEVVLCRGIQFEDKKIDLKIGHPGIVLLPTSEKEQYLYCLYMTSDEIRMSKEKQKYERYYGHSLKLSYINLQQIIKKENRIDVTFDKVEDNEFLYLLKKFYTYQNNLENKSTYFLEIKRKIEIMIALLEFNLKYNIEKSITVDEINGLEKVNSYDKIIMLYYIYIITFKKYKEQLADKENKFISDFKYFNSLLELIEIIKSVNFEKINLNDSNNELRNIYNIMEKKYYSLNMESFFEDSATIFYMLKNNSKIPEIINNFLRFEDERNK